MKLVNAELFLELEIDENTPAALIIEHPDTMTQVVEDIRLLCQGGEGDFVLSEDGKEISLEKMADIIIDPFAIDFNSRKIQSKLYGELQEAESFYAEERALIQTSIIKYLDDLSVHVPYEMITSDLNLDSLRIFKMFEVRLEPRCESLLERLIEYTKVMTRLMKKRVLILVNATAYLNPDALMQLCEMCNYQKLHLLFIEYQERVFPFPIKEYIIDRDKCLIIK